MNGYGMLANRYLKQQRRRSLLTILAILLSVALISALGTMSQALKDNVLAQQIRENGSFHFSYSGQGPELYDKLRKHALIDRIGVLDRSAENGVGANFKLYVQEANRDAFALLPIHVLDGGRVPERPDEIVIEAWIAERMDGAPGLGDTVTLNGPDGAPHGYRVVGLLQNQKQNQMYQKGAAYTLAANDAPADGNALLFVTFKPGVDISSHLPAFAELGKPFDTNNTVLALMGEAADHGLNQALSVIFGTLVGLVVLSTIAVIYNAFHISVLERIRQFGLMRTIGATPQQIRGLVFREATTLAAIGIPLGLAIGWGALWLVLWLMIQGGFHILQMEEFHLTFHWWVMGLSVGVGLAAIYAAAWLPARKASRVSPVDAVKGAGSIVRETYRRMRLPSPLGLIGIEGRMAVSNIRRNRTKFRITTFSIVISVMLFIVFHYFTQEAFRITVDTTENTKIAFELTRYSVRTDIAGTDAEGRVPDIVSEARLEEIRRLPGVEQVYGIYELPMVTVHVPETLMNPDFSARFGIELDPVKVDGQPGRQVYATLDLFDEARLETSARYLEAGTADPEKLTAEDGVILIQTVRPFNREAGKKEIVPLTRYKVGDMIALHLGGEDGDIRKVKVMGLLSQSAFDAAYQESVLRIAGTKATLAKLIEAAPADARPFGTALMGVSVALEDGADSVPVRVALERLTADIPGGQLINLVDQQREDRQFNLQMQIFVYGFLAVIGLIGSLNIVNTVQTNLLLRRREFGLLQAVGMTTGQIRKMATAEGVWFGVLGGFWGIVLGVAGSYFLFHQVSDIEGVPFRFPWSGAVISAVFALGIGLLSVQGPMRRLAKANVIEELREDA